MFRLAGRTSVVCVDAGRVFGNSVPVCRVVAPLWQQTLVGLEVQLHRTAGAHAPGGRSRAQRMARARAPGRVKCRCVRGQEPPRWGKSPCVVRIGTGDVAVGGRSRCGRQQEPLLQPAGATSGWQETLLLWSEETVLRVAGAPTHGGRKKDTAVGGRMQGGRAEGVALEVVEDQDETWVAANWLLQCHVSRWTCQFVAVEQCRGRHGHTPRHGEVPGIR